MNRGIIKVEMDGWLMCERIEQKEENKIEPKVSKIAMITNGRQWREGNTNTKQTSRECRR